VFVPGFAEYARALWETGCHVTEIPLSADFCLTQEQLTQIPQDCELLFLCNPNNPTGLLSGRELLLQLLDLCRERGTVVAMDECFLDFCEDAADCSLVSALAQYPELIIIKAFTKTCAMAGLRLGYALCGSTELAEKLRDCGQPWAVSAVAQAAGEAALREEAYINRLRALITAERRRLIPALEALGLRVIPGEANFLLFRADDPALARRLRERGILVRGCGNFEGLDEHWIRVAVRSGEENNSLCRALGEVLHG
jgi:threonine-phosphate decarboxylase